MVRAHLPVKLASAYCGLSVSMEGSFNRQVLDLGYICRSITPSSGRIPIWRHHRHRRATKLTCVFWVRLRLNAVKNVQDTPTRRGHLWVQNPCTDI